MPVIVSINNFTSDTQAEVDLLRRLVSDAGAQVVLATHWADGGAGTEDLARAVVEMCEQPSEVTFVYPDDATLWEKIEAIAKRVYRADEVTASSKVRTQLRELQDMGYGHLPVCIAKTQYSFSTDAALRGAPTGHSLDVREVRLSAGAEFVVVVCGDIMTMPGLPKAPAAQKIDLVDGAVVGLF